MSEKKILRLLTIIMILTTLITVFFAYGTVAYATKDNQNITVDFITDTDTYANLSNPQILASNGKTIIAINGNNVTNVTENHTGSINLDADYSIIDVAVDNNAIYLLATILDTDDYKLYISDYNFNLIENITFNSSGNLNENTVVDLFNTNTDTYFVSGQTVYTVSTDIDNATLTAVAVPNLTNKNNLNNISNFDGEYYSYFYTSNGVSKFNTESNKFIKEYNIATRDYVIQQGNIYYLENDKLIKQTKDNVTNEYALDFIPRGIYLHNSSLLITAPTENKIYCLDLGTDILTGNYGDYGSGLNRLHSPTDVSTFNRNVYVADSKNNRIIKHSISDKQNSEIKLKHSPLLLTTSKEFVAYMSKINGNYEIFICGDTTSVYSTPKQIINIESKNNDIYILTTEGDIIVINSITGESEIIIKSTDIVGINHFEIPEHSAYLYYSADGSLYKYNLQTLKTNTVADTSVNNGFAVDYNGNIFSYNNNSITKNNTDAKQLVNFGINNDEVISYKLCNMTGNFYAVTKNHRLFEINTSSINSKCYDNDRYDAPTDFNIIKLGIFKNSATDIIGYIDSPNNIENTRIIDNSEWFIVLTKITENAIDYYYVSNGNGSLFMYIEVKFFDNLIDNAATDYLLSTLSDNVDVYKYPFESSEVNTTLKNNTKIQSMQLLTNNSDWNWHYITYTENGSQKFGYIKANDVSKISDNITEFMQIFKVKSDKIGHKVKIYSKPSFDSEVLFDKVNDGEEIKAYFINSEEDFTRVYYKDTYGYITSNNLIKDTMLTPNQILAICVSIGSVLALAIIIVLAVYIRKRKKINIKLLDNNL